MLKIRVCLNLYGFAYPIKVNAHLDHFEEKVLEGDGIPALEASHNCFALFEGLRKFIRSYLNGFFFFSRPVYLNNKK